MQARFRTRICIGSAPLSEARSRSGLRRAIGRTRRGFPRPERMRATRSVDVIRGGWSGCSLERQSSDGRSEVVRRSFDDRALVEAYDDQGLVVFGLDAAGEVIELADDSGHDLIGLLRAMAAKCVQQPLQIEHRPVR